MAKSSKRLTAKEIQILNYAVELTRVRVNLTLANAVKAVKKAIREVTAK